MKVFIADDEAIIREGLKYIIDWEELDFQICGEASNGEDTLNGILELNPDLVLLDIRMPKLQGTEIVKLAREKNYTGKFIILSGYSDFKYAQTAIRYGVDYYLTKPLDEEELYQAVKSLQEVLRKEHSYKNSLEHYMEKAKYVILRDILTGNGNIPAFQQKDMNLSYSIYQAVIYESYNQEIHNPTYNFAELLRVTNQGNNSFDYIELHQKRVILLKGEFALERFRNFLEHYESTPQKGSPLDSLFLTFGRPVPVLEEIHSSYEDAFKLLSRRFFCEAGQHAIGFLDLPGANEATYKITPEETRSYCEKFTNYLQSHNRKMLVETLYQLSKKLYNANTDSAGIKLFLTDIHLQVKQDINRLYSAANIPFATNSSAIDFIESKYYLYEILQFFSEQFEMIMNALGNPTSDCILDDILYYIDHNYKENLKLEAIAPLFGYNSSYLGKILNKKVGECFNSYVDRIRINHSKQLLLEQDLKVYEVAEKVGYKNVDYFHKKFKKYVNMSPAEFRKTHGVKESSPVS